MRDSRLERLADVLVNYSAGVKKGQLVRLSGPPVAQPLIVELYRKVLAAGGHPMVRMAPDEFIAIAEEAGLIVDIGTFVMDQTARQLAVWQRAMRSQPSAMFSRISRSTL